jgi:hypothetical protein
MTATTDERRDCLARAGAADSGAAQAELTGLARDMRASWADNLESHPKKPRDLSGHAAPDGAAVSGDRCHVLDASQAVS